ncbi:MAG: hypothetical protein IJK77_02095 [Lachnospiraceae bacterium]|nr:hypothetical protein [Lachnospiraceae bacterium]
MRTKKIVFAILGIILFLCISFLTVKVLTERNITERSSRMKEELRSQGYLQLQNVSFQDGIVCYTATTDQEKILGIQDMLLIRAEREQARFEAMRSPRLFHRYSALRQVIVSPNGTVLYDQKLMNFETISKDNTESLYISENKPTHSKEETVAALKESFRQNGLSLEVLECSEYSLGGYQVTLSYKDEKGTTPDIDTINAAANQCLAVIDNLNKNGESIGAYQLQYEPEDESDVLFLLSADLIFRDFLWWQSPSLGGNTWTGSQPVK